MSHRHQDFEPSEHPERVTMAYLHAQLADLLKDINRLKLYVAFIAGAIALPKFGGPDPSALVSAVLKHVA